ncbi:MAG: YceI family protein [Bacteroidetes bacterium]|nr:YceI family protein [Bacteroidota bacterium]
MKTLLITFILVISTSVQAQDQKTYQLNAQESIINWRGTYSFLFSEHTGTVHFKEGTLIAEKGNIKGGDFTIDMTTITNEDYKKGVGAVKHLRSDDFFNVTKHTEAQLGITKVEYYANENRHKISADLTIKGITKSIEFWADVDGTAKTLMTKFKIDRVRWGITHNSKTRDHAISDAIEFDVHLQF